MKSLEKAPGAGLRVIVAGLALFGLVGVLPVSLAEITSGDACPHLGVLPVCHLVSLAYSVILLTVLHRRLWRPWLFLLAWLPIFALAATGSGLELMGHETCPKTEAGIPKCFFSLALAVALFLPVLVHIGRSRRIAAQRT